MSANKFQMLPTPPESQRSSRAARRKLNSSEESTASSQSTGSILIDITASEFRLGIPAPMRALPLRTTYVSPKSPISVAYQPIKYDVHQILRDLGISYSTVDLVQRWEPGKSPTAADITILIEAEQSQHWQAALNDIQTLIIKNKLPFMRLEIMNEKAILNFFLPTSNTALKGIWDSSLKARVLDTLGLAGQWQSLTILNRGHTQDISVPTVTIELTESADQLWQQVVYQNVLEMLEDYPGLVDKHIAFVRPSTLANVERNPPPAALPADAFSGLVSMGSSIGIGPSSGTIGGYVDLRFQRKVYTMGLTNHHVVENDTMTADEKANGLAPSFARSNLINAPSQADTNASIEAFEDHRESIRSTLYGPLANDNNPQGPRRSESGLEFKIQYGDPSAKLKNDYQTLMAMEASVGNDINGVKNTDLRFGSVFASSGTGRYYGALEPHQLPLGRRSIETGNAIDWALVNVSNGARIGGNLISQDLRFDANFAAFGRTITHAQHADIQPGAKLFKKGRSGTSVGTVSGYDVELLLKGTLYRAAVVMPTNVGRTEEFLFGGDSGSFCTDRLGTFCALGFAGNSNTGAGHVIPTSWIYEDIRARTGAVIENPRLI